MKAVRINRADMYEIVGHIWLAAGAVTGATLCAIWGGVILGYSIWLEVKKK